MCNVSAFEITKEYRLTYANQSIKRKVIISNRCNNLHSGRVKAQSNQHVFSVDNVIWIITRNRNENANAGQKVNLGGRSMKPSKIGSAVMRRPFEVMLFYAILLYS